MTTTNMNTRCKKTAGKGAALLVVLFIVMVITVLSLGFLTRSDVELACGVNMVTRTKMDYLAESGLEHAKGLILNPQDISTEYWTGGSRQQLVTGSDDYYDLEVLRDPTDNCNYTIDCNAYRFTMGELRGFSGVRANLRLDPCIALWTGADTTILSGATIDGDVFCNDGLINKGIINGDVFADTYSGSGSKTGQRCTVSELSLEWPELTIEGFTSHYSVDTITSDSISSQTYGSLDPVRVCYRGSDSDLELAGNTQIYGMLLVDGDLVVSGNRNTITAAKNLPALFVTGDLRIEAGGELQIYGLVVVDGNMQLSAGSADVNILGGLFIRGTIIETASDSSGNGNDGRLYNGPTWNPSGGVSGSGAIQFDGGSSAVEINTNDMSSSQGTVSLWAYANYFDYNTHYLFGHTSQESWSDRIQLYTNDRDGLLDLGLGDSHSRKTNIQDLYVHKWYHIVLTWDGTNYVVYVDGTEKATDSYTGLSALGEVADIGNNGNPSSRNESFNGLIDEVRIYDRALDVNDIDEGMPTDYIGYWKFDESGSSITITAAPSKTAINIWSEEGDIEKWGQAAGAFFRSIERK